MSITSAGKASIQISSRASSAAEQGLTDLHGMLMHLIGKQGRPGRQQQRTPEDQHVYKSGNAGGTSLVRDAADKFNQHDVAQWPLEGCSPGTSWRLSCCPGSWDGSCTLWPS